MAPLNRRTACLLAGILILGGAVCFDAALLTIHWPIPAPHTPGPPVILDVRDPALLPSALAWQIEVARRFPRAVAVVCHGGNIVHGEWIVLDNPGGVSGEPAERVDTLLDREAAEYPDRQVVLIACNPRHIAVHGHPNCWYFDSSVWVVPDRAVPAFSTGTSHTMDEDADAFPNDIYPRSTQQPGVCGNIFEACEAR